MTIQKYWIYRIYSPSGDYRGILRNVSSPFSYNQNIATTFVQVQITVALNADNADQAVSAILDETGNQILDEAGNVITDEGIPSPIGDGNSNNLIANNNLVKVYEVSNYYPTGTKVFDGYISKFKPIYNSNNVLVTLISNGNDAKDYYVQGSPYLADQSQTLENTIATLPGGFPDNGIHSQTWTVGAGVSKLDAIDVYLDGATYPDTYTLSVYTAPNGGTLLGSSNVAVSTLGVVKFIFPSTIAVTAGVSYFFNVKGTGTPGAPCGYQNTDVYAGGSAWQYGYGPYTSLGYDLYFVTYYNVGGTTTVFNNADVSTIMSSVISNYGGFITVPVGGYANTGTLTTYKFTSQTVLKALSVIQSLAPANWYWYVDPSTNILQFSKANTTADITLIKGRHINDLEIEATKENIKNVAYFTGGDDGTGTNIFVKVTNSTSTNRTGLIELSDNRISAANIGTLSAAQAVARLIAQNYLNNNSAETYQATVAVQDQTMDINLLKIGLMVGFRGFSTWENSLLLQIVGINRMADQAILQLGTLPLRANKAVQQIQAQLTAQQTVANPSSPS